MPSRDFKRSDRIAAELRRVIGASVHRAVRDHGLPSVSVVDVEVTKELDVATVWVVALRADDAADVVGELNQMAGEFRHEAAHAMRLRRMPELRFRYDDSMDKAEKIDELLRDS